MDIFKRVLGKILYGVAKVVSVVLDAFIKLIETIVIFVRNIARGFAALIGMGGCLILMLLAGPFGIVILMNPVVLLTILFFVVFPILGTKFVSYLKYLRYTITEFLFDRANYLIDGIGYQFKTFSEYKNAYKKMEEERKRREEQRRFAEQQREWEEMFRQWYEYQDSQRGSNYGGQGSYGYNYVNPSVEFKNKYEKSCDLLGVGYDADKYEIKLAYRKKAKEYHPDLNKSPNATSMFQQINEAYEFLSDENIERYTSIR
ncbi:J domain-containing protein [Clostridium sp. Cult2]|uniref:J domain-containing protein n=1 Tax=Clostridium sp. Cult2 TaxID=2079003 RepID=UPI001F428EA6|nr:DnaJ domain-containing protein [Clostridium sp. Cult2]MCF6465329.1 molecular chaperone DnaJ [Clostridium sp. Cult2]